MKLPSSIVVIVVPALLLSGVSANLHGKKTKASALCPHRSTITPNKLGRIRGGGSEGSIIPFITKDGMTAFGAVDFGVNGVPRAADPVKYWEHQGIKIPSGTLAEFSAQWNGVADLGIAILSYLAMFSSDILSVSHMIAYASLPCLFFTFKTWYKDNFKRLGFWKGFGMLVTTAILGPVCMLLAGKGNPNIVGAFLYGPCLAVGSLCYLLPETSVKLCGLNGFSSAVEKTFWKLQGIALQLWGIHAYLTMQGKDAFESMKMLFTILVPCILDLRFLRPLTGEAGFPEGTLNFYVLFLLGTATLFYAVG